jgi:hypothetical protein
VAVIGKRWLELMTESQSRLAMKKGEEEDFVFLEVRAALLQEKKILPLLVDGATMPRVSELPPGIKKLHYYGAVQIPSIDTPRAIADKLVDVAKRLLRARTLKARWKDVYLWFSVLAYVVCAVLTNVVGLWEYGEVAWAGMVKVWGGFYIWPALCLPFALIALDRPLTLVFEATSSALVFRSAGVSRRRYLLTYLTPLILGGVLTLLAVVVEVLGEYEAPWTIHPQLMTQCDRARNYASEQDAALRGALSHYDALRTLEAEYKRAPSAEVPFWLRDKCWPNVFFYLIEPAYRPILDQNYHVDRPRLQALFVAMLRRNTTDAPYSYTFFFYVMSFFIQIWLAATGVILSMFYARVPITRDDHSTLRLPSEDAYLCLTYAFVTLMIWLPFRMNTVYIKKLYFCSDLQDCSFDINNYQNDLLLGLILLIGYCYLTVQLLREFNRRKISLLGGAVTAAIVICGAAIVNFSDATVRLAESWQFYVRFCIVVFIVLTALWFQFNPEYIHRRDIEKDMNQTQS